MKVRNGFVTNSSSSNFVIAYKSDSSVPIKAFPKMVKYILESTGEYHQTEKAEIIKNIDDYNNYFLDRYGYGEDQAIEDIVQEDNRMQEIYDSAIDYLNAGYIIAAKRVDNWDEDISGLIREMNDKDNFIILEDDEY